MTIFEQITAATGFDGFEHNCHSASLAYIRSGLAPEGARVARGWCEGVGGQHSWVYLGGDAYDYDATIHDITLWSYDPSVEGMWVGTRRDGRHTPHGGVSVFETGMPRAYTDDYLTVTGLSDAAEFFLSMIGPLDLRGWANLFHGGVEGFPAAEILGKLIEQHPTVAAFVPIDVRAMLLRENPGGLYW